MKRLTLIGAGLIGQERLKAVETLRERGHSVRVTTAFDPYQPRLGDLAKLHGFTPRATLGEALDQPADLVVIACPHDVAVDCACQAIEKGHTVLMEKPIGRSPAETDRIVHAARTGQPFFVGFNYRFMPGIARLWRDWHDGQFGQPISLRLQMGHGGRPGDEKTWKLDPVRCGGGALLDPGIHLLDLCRLFLGEPLLVQGVTAWRGFWKTGIEEDAQALLAGSTANASVDVSVVRWRSSFDLFALGSDGYGHVTGRGRSYGRQIYRRGPRWGWQAAPNQAASETVVVDDACEDSFARELAGCLKLEEPPVIPPADMLDGVAVMQLYALVRSHLPSSHGNPPVG